MKSEDEEAEEAEGDGEGGAEEGEARASKKPKIANAIACEWLTLFLYRILTTYRSCTGVGPQSTEGASPF